MKKSYISVIGLGFVSLSACESTPVSNPPPKPYQTYNPPPDTGLKTALPTWESVAPPKEGAKAELILTPSGCYKNFVSKDTEPKDRYVENVDLAKIGTRIECPERAKDLSKEPAVETQLERPGRPLNVNPPRTPRRKEESPPKNP